MKEKKTRGAVERTAARYLRPGAAMVLMIGLMCCPVHAEEQVAVTVDAGSNGSVNEQEGTFVEMVPEGSTYEVKIAADEGHVISEVLINEEELPDEEQAGLIGKKTGSLTLDNVSEDVEVSAVFREKNQSDNSGTDGNENGGGVSNEDNDAAKEDGSAGQKNDGRDDTSAGNNDGEEDGKNDDGKADADGKNDDGKADADGKNDDGKADEDGKNDDGKADEDGKNDDGKADVKTDDNSSAKAAEDDAAGKETADTGKADTNSASGTESGDTKETAASDAGNADADDAAERDTESAAESGQASEVKTSVSPKTGDELPQAIPLALLLSVACLAMTAKRRIR